jgi:SNF2 family DNA or RNA helicase
MAIEKGKFAVFADCGLGKTFILTEFARHALNALPKHKRVLIVSPLMVVGQTIAESDKFYGGKLPIERVTSRNLHDWLNGNGERLGIVNYDALNDDVQQGDLGALILDESSMLKSHYGKWGQACIRLGKGLRFKLAATGTPAPNDRIEYANHSVFLDAFPTINSFLARDQCCLRSPRVAIRASPSKPTSPASSAS